jgi:hypothetical protein
MILCPICGAKVEDPAKALEPSLLKLESEMAGNEGAKRNGSAVLTARRPQTRTIHPENIVTPPPMPAVEAPKEEVPLKVTLFPKAEHPEPPPEDPMGDPLSVDASVLLLRSAPESKMLPVSSRPLNAPAILGGMALVTGLLFPITLALESHRIIGILGFSLCGFLLPFAPIAWIAGLGAEKRRREQNLRPERRIVIGRLLGQIGTVLLIVELTAALILIAGFRLSGSFPSTFWKLPQPF